MHPINNQKHTRAIFSGDNTSISPWRRFSFVSWICTVLIHIVLDRCIHISICTPLHIRLWQYDMEYSCNTLQPLHHYIWWQYDMEVRTPDNNHWLKVQLREMVGDMDGGDDLVSPSIVPPSCWLHTTHSPPNKWGRCKLRSQQSDSFRQINGVVAYPHVRIPKYTLRPSSQQIAERDWGPLNEDWLDTTDIRAHRNDEEASFL